MATKSNTDYLKFNAFSIKDLITRKLAQDSTLTDAIYPGSTLATIIDIISYMYQTLMYNVNSAAAESMWQDTKIYENINRLCNFIGYNPHGMNPSTAVFSFPLEQIREREANSPFALTIPRYSYIDTGMNDSTGKRICFSTVNDIEIGNSTAANKEIVLYNGRWKMYDMIFTAEGVDWETFTLDGLRSDTSTNEFVANNYVHVYVSEPIGNGEFSRPEQYFMTDGGLFKSRNEYFDDNGNSLQSEVPIPQLYRPEDKIFNLRLDETKTYTVTFGNNRQGRKLKRGSAIFIFYLDSNGPIAQFGLNQINGNLITDFSGFLQSRDDKVYENVYQKILGITQENSNQYVTQLNSVSNVTQTGSFVPEESVDEIRDFAPNWFRMGNRLVTQRDYEYFLNNSPAFRGSYADVKCMNNWGYMSTFYKWLYEMGKKYQLEINPTDTLGGRRFLKQDNILKTSRKFADPADSNNIYLWVVPSSSTNLNVNDVSTWIGGNVDDWKRSLLQIKDLTHEPYFVPALLTKFAICAVPNYDYVRENYLFSTAIANNFSRENYIEVTIDDEVIYANASIKTQIQNIIYNFFRADNFKIGQYIDFNLLQDQIFSINGVNRIRTVFKPADDNTSVPVSIRNGLCFASWTDDPILQIRNRVEGIDLEVSSAGRSLEPFQFPSLALNIEQINVTIIKRSAASLNTVAY